MLPSSRVPIDGGAAETLIQGILAHDDRAIARLIRAVDDGTPGAAEAVDALAKNAQDAVVIGVTGPPGSGKSTLIGRLAARWLGDGERVAVIAVDPSSPFSGGAVLGDRLRIGGMVQSAGLIVCSLGTRGALGGLSHAVPDALSVLAAAGATRILIETVGVGQDEVDVAALSDTTLVLSVPGLGDDVQAIKAGVLEISDIFIVNKMDRPGARRVARDLELAQDSAFARQQRRPPVVLTNALSGTGLDGLLEEIGAHQVWLGASGRRLVRRAARAEYQLRARVRRRFETWLDESLCSAAGDRLQADLAAGVSTAGTAATELWQLLRSGSGDLP